MAQPREDLWTEEETATLRSMFAAGDSDATIAAAIGRSAISVDARRGVLRLYRRKGSVRPMPEGFAGDIAAGLSRDQLMAKHRCGAASIVRWRQELGDTFRRYRPRADAPDGFAQVAAGLTRREAALRFGHCDEVIKRWYAEAGISPRPAQLFRSSVRPGHGLAAQGDGSLATSAARHLMRFYSNVFRCSILDAATRKAKGLGDGSGHYSIAGIGIITVDEMLDRARAKGWRTDDMQVAA